MKVPLFMCTLHNGDILQVDVSTVPRVIVNGEIALSPNKKTSTIVA